MPRIFGEFFLVSVSHETKHENSSKFSGKFGAKFGAKFGPKIRKICLPKFWAKFGWPFWGEFLPKPFILWRKGPNRSESSWEVFGWFFAVERLLRSPNKFRLRCWFRWEGCGFLWDAFRDSQRKFREDHRSWIGCCQRTTARETPAISTRKCLCQKLATPMSNSWSSSTYTHTHTHHGASRICKILQKFWPQTFLSVKLFFTYSKVSPPEFIYVRLCFTYSEITAQNTKKNMYVIILAGMV